MSSLTKREICFLLFSFVNEESLWHVKHVSFVCANSNRVQKNIPHKNIKKYFPNNFFINTKSVSQRISLFLSAKLLVTLLIYSHEVRIECPL